MRMRFGVMVVGAASIVAFLHCGGGDDSTGAQSNDGGSNDSSTIDASPTDAGDGGSSVVTVDGTLVRPGNNLEPTAPLPNRAVVIIDANEKVTKVTTDANGKFEATNVATPYDIAVPYSLPDAGNNLLTPRYYIGISRADPIVESSDEAVSPPVDTTPRMATINVTLTSCATCAYVFYGCGGASGNGAAAPVLSFPCTWQGAATHTSAFHGFISDATGAFISGVDIPVQSFNAGDNVQLGTPTMHAVTNASVSVSATIPAGYTFDNLSVDFTESDGVDLPRPSVPTLMSTDDYPFVPNLNVTLTAAAEGDAGETARYVIASSGTSVPATIAANVPAASVLLTPDDQATGVTDAKPFTWSAASTPSLYTIFVYTSKVEVFVYTTGTTIDPSRLTKAGIGLDAATKYSWLIDSLQNQGGKMDDFVVAPSTASTLGVATVTASSATHTFTTQ